MGHFVPKVSDVYDCSCGAHWSQDGRMFMCSLASGTMSSRPVAMNRKKMAASRRRHPFLCLQFTQDSFIGSPKHHAAQDIREGGQAPGDGVGQQS